MTHSMRMPAKHAGEPRFGGTYKMLFSPWILENSLLSRYTTNSLGHLIHLYSLPLHTTSSSVAIASSFRTQATINQRTMSASNTLLRPGAEDPVLESPATNESPKVLTPLKCPMSESGSCNESFTTCRLLKLHLASVHNCQHGCMFSDCPSACWTANQLKQHYAGEHDREHGCKFGGCSFAYPFANMLKEHYADVHALPYDCTYDDCSCSYARPDLLKYHYSDDHDLPFGCQIFDCTEAFAGIAEVKHHQGEAHDLTAGCRSERCPLSFQLYDSLVKHNTLVHRNGQGRCPHHDAECTWRNDGSPVLMTRHIEQVHRGLWTS